MYLDWSDSSENDAIILIIDLTSRDQVKNIGRGGGLLPGGSRGEVAPS